MRTFESSIKKAMKSTKNNIVRRLEDVIVVLIIVLIVWTVFESFH
jgi:hypothetical protein